MDIRALEQQPDTMEEYARSFRDEVWPQLSDRVCQLYTSSPVSEWNTVTFKCLK